ncbi:MAG: O-antigen ligase family protein [Kiritimatiellae bacterium]|nr:O-antigen ligase family protein [Kiritimatiellia bacterium]
MSAPAAIASTAPYDGRAAPVEGAVAAYYGSRFWDCSLSRLERWILSFCIASTMALQVQPILHSGIALPLILLMSALCWLTPVTGFFYIACAQFLPFPEGAAYNPAQIGVATWIAVTFLKYRKMDLRGFGYLWPVLPWLLWYWLVSGENIWHFNSEYFKALTYSVIACQQVNAARGNYLKCLLGMCVGTLMATTAFWAYQLGLPVDLSTWGGEREGYARLGGVRADAVMIWPPLLMGCFGTMGVALSAMVSGRFPKQIHWLKILTVVAFFVSVPPLVATMTHGAYAGFALMSIFVALVYARMKRLRLIKKQGAGLTPIVVTLVSVLVLIYLTNAFRTRERVDALYHYFQYSVEEYGGAASRTDVWEYSLKTIIKHPLVGIRFNDDPEDIPAEYFEFGGYLSHNVFLDYGRWTGIPGISAVIFFFLYPLLRLWRRSDNWRFMGFFLFHFALLIFWMSLSFQFYKTFWGFWMLAALVAAREPVAVPARGSGHMRLQL